MARRGLTPPRGDGFFATVNFGEETGPNSPVSSPKFMVANMPRWPSAVTRRAAAQRRTRHSASQMVVPYPRSLVALWRVDGAWPAWRLGLSSYGTDRPCGARYHPTIASVTPAAAVSATTRSGGARQAT